MSDDESRGVHLSDKQLVFVFMAATVVVVVVFLCGVLVGRGVQRARGPLAADGTEASAQVVPDGTTAEAPVADGAVRQPGGGAAGSTEYSYPARLGKTPPAEQLKPVPPAEDSPRASGPPQVPAEPAAPGPAKAPTSAASPAARYTVQVAAVKRRDEADDIVKRLKTKGYDAFVFVPEDGSDAGVFRVRIGAFTDKRQAELLAERLLREEKRYKPWVTR
jgi:cell division septation protein DedD